MNRRQSIANAVAVLASTCRIAPKAADLPRIAEHITNLTSRYRVDVVRDALVVLHGAEQFPTMRQVDDACTAIVAASELHENKGKSE